MIYAAGDSHIHIFQNNPKFTWLPDIPATAYQMINENSRLKAGPKIMEYCKKYDGPFIFSAGEIDCRIHIYHVHKRDKKPLFSVIEETVNRLIAFVNKLLDINPDVYILGIPPPGWQENFYNYPNYADPDMHAKIYKVFNAMALDRCELNRINYINMYDKFVGPDGHTFLEYLRDDNIHLTTSVAPYVIEQMENRQFWRHGR